MKTSCCAAAALVAAGLGACTAQIQNRVATAQEIVTALGPEDFVFSLGGPEPLNPVDGFEIRGASLNELPALDGKGVSMALVNLDACTINLPHVHPRATEMLYMIEGDLISGFVEENGGEGAVLNDITQGDVTFFPQGLIHYEQNLECSPATFLSALSSEDPGAVTITTRFFELPSEAIQASLNLNDPELEALLSGLSQSPAEARRECLRRCGLPQTAVARTSSSDSDDDGHPRA